MKEPKTDNQTVQEAYLTYLTSCDDYKQTKTVLKERRREMKEAKKAYKRVYKAFLRAEKAGKAPGKLRAALSDARLKVLKKFRDKYEKLQRRKEEPQGAALEELMEDMDKLEGMLDKLKLNPTNRGDLKETMTNAISFFRSKGVGDEKTQARADKFLEKMTCSQPA